MAYASLSRALVVLMVGSGCDLRQAPPSPQAAVRAVSPPPRAEPVRLNLAADYVAEPHPVYIIDRSKFDDRFRPVVVPYETSEPVGTIVVNTTERLLYLVEKDGMARRYGVGVGAEGRAWRGVATVAAKRDWPAWRPTPRMRAQNPELPAVLPASEINPLGARALYLFQNGRDTLYRIHGTSAPWTIGDAQSSGCIRMFNEDVIDLEERVRKGAKVIVT